MRIRNSGFALALGLVYGSMAGAQPMQRMAGRVTQIGMPMPRQPAGVMGFQQERAALQILLQRVEKNVVSASEAMPADKYVYAPSEGEFKGVRTFGAQIKHMAATNYILAAAALGEDPPQDAGDESGPDSVRTKAEILEYLKGSFAKLENAAGAIGDDKIPVKASPISPLPATKATRITLIVEALIHAFDHCGQMVEYLRLNGIVPPASLP